jgi:hypothetical protein
VIYRVSGVRSFVVVDRRIFVERGETVEVRDVGTGGITASVPRSGGDTDVRSLWAAAENGAWRSSGTVLMRHDDTAVPAGVVRSSAPIVAVAAIADAGLVALTEEGTVAFIGPEGTQHTTFTSGTAGSRIAANADGCYLYGPTGLTALSLPSGGKTFRLQRPIHALAVTPNKLYLAVNGRLLCRNAHTGEAISAVAGSFDGLALYRGRVYAVDSAGIVRCYTGEADAVAPTTEFRITGRAGQGGYFTEPATVTVAASDRDSQVRRTLLKHADGAWAPAPGRLELGDGRHVLYAYSEDTAGRREALRTRTVWVDGTPPGTTVTVHGRQGKNGWFVSQPTVRLHSTDATSGVAETSYRLNGGPWHRYTGPFRLSVAGRVTVEARAADRAGNLGAAADRDISVDTTPPELEVLISPAGAGPAAAAAVARDEESGVASVEYRVDGGPWRPYRGPVAVHGVGPGEVNVRAENGAGLRLQRRVILPGGTPLAKRHAATADDAPPAAAPGQPRARLRPADLRFTYWLPGRALLRVTGDRVPLDHRPTGPQAAPVPAWLRGSTYLLTHPLDRLYAGRCLAAWVSRRFLVVYALVPPSAGPDMTGWTLIERSPVVRFDKPGQAAPGDGERVRCSVFMRRFEPGETVRLPGAASSRSGSQVLYFFARQAMHPAAR